MALLLYDGFETGLIMRNAATIRDASVAVGRDGIGKSIRSNNNLCDYTVPLPGGGSGSGIVGIGWRPQNSSLALLSNQASNYHLSVSVDATGHVDLRRGSTSGTQLALALDAVDRTAWHYYQIKFNIADSGGSCIIKQDGVTVIDYTGDTRNGGNVPVDAFRFNGSVAANTQIDDLYILDLSGPAPYNDWIGERIVKAMVPTGAGALTELTPSAGANWDCVNEDPWSATADSVSGASGTDTYAHSDVSGYALIDAVQVGTYAQKTDTGTRTMRTVMRSAGGTVVESGDLPLTTSVVVVQGALRQTDPDGAAWTQETVNSTEYGVKVT